jgi:hypothetical protein
MHEPDARPNLHVRLNYWARVAIVTGLGICAAALTALATIP